MPFGFFDAQPRKRRLKQPKPPPKPPEPRRAPPPPPPPPPAPERPAAAPPVNSMKVHILLLVRSLAIAREFLCSMHQNMGEALHVDGLSFYTRELETIAEVVDRKKRLEQFFWTFSQADWTFPAEETDSRAYTFTISPAGDQGRALDLVIRCMTPQALSGQGAGHADAVWLLADGVLWDETRGFDPYADFLRETLSGLAPAGGGPVRPVCLILSQLEHLGHFDGASGRSELPEALSRRLAARCREQFALSCPRELPAVFIPVQVYGGMEYVRADEKGDPVLHIGRSGYYQSYIPDNCHIPGLYTLQAIAAGRNADFFADAPCGGLTACIRRHYGIKFGSAGWTPAPLREEESG